MANSMPGRKTSEHNSRCRDKLGEPCSTATGTLFSALSTAHCRLEQSRKPSWPSRYTALTAPLQDVRSKPGIGGTSAAMRFHFRHASSVSTTPDDSPWSHTAKFCASLAIAPQAAITVAGLRAISFEMWACGASPLVSSRQTHSYSTRNVANSGSMTASEPDAQASKNRRRRPPGAAKMTITRDSKPRVSGMPHAWSNSCNRAPALSLDFRTPHIFQGMSSRNRNLAFHMLAASSRKPAAAPDAWFFAPSTNFCRATPTRSFSSGARHPFQMQSTGLPATS